VQIAGQSAELPEIRRRVRIMAILILVSFLGLAGRLFYLQIVEGDNFYRMTSEAVIRTKTLPALRGEIRDRNGRVLATTRASYNVEVVPDRIDRQQYERLLLVLAEHPTPLPEWESFLEKTAKRRDRPYQLAQDVSRSIMASLEADMDSRGTSVVAIPRREYPFKQLASHTLGYLNEVSADELRTLSEEGYRPSDLIGRAGVEKQLEPYLRGRKGFRKILAERRGIRPSEIQLSDLVDGPIEVAPVPGENLILTVDVDVQKIVERALAPHRAGAVVVLDVETGRILAMASTPGFDSNEMSGQLTLDASARLFGNPFRPFRHRALSETYGPGSTFKVVSALAALEDGLISPDEKTRCNHFVQIGRRRFKCTKNHGVVNLHKAIVESCNVYFYELAMRPGIMNRFTRYANELGLGAPSGVGLPGENPGFIPTEQWHRERARSESNNSTFMIGHVLNTAIGEGANRVTALQMALVYTALATNGVLWLPQIIERIESYDGKVLETFPPRVRRHISISPETMAVLKNALVGVVNTPGGTAYKARSTLVKVAGKTGTSQVRKGPDPKTGEPPLPHEQLDHAWFAGFAPADNPRIAFAVIIEHGGHGGDVAAPVAVNISERYMELLTSRHADASPSTPPGVSRTATAASQARPMVP